MRSILKKYISIVTIVAAIVACSDREDLQQPDVELVKNQISKILEKDSLPPLEKNKVLKQLISSFPSDSTKLNYYFRVVNYYYKADDSANFRKWQTEAKRMSLKVNDSSYLAKSYWFLGNFLKNKNQLDSSFINYKKANTIFTKIGSLEYAGRLLTAMAIIQKNIGDLTGSEITSFEALDFLDQEKNSNSLYSVENNLGIVYNELGEFGKALEHHQKALSYLDQMAGSEISKAISLNNMGVVNQNAGNYKEAIQNYDKALAIDSVLLKDPHLFAMLLDNKAYSSLKLKDTANVAPLFNRAFTIRDSINHLAGIIMSKSHLAEYHALKLDSTKAVQYLKEANALALKIGSKRDLLSTYKMLAQLDLENSQNHLSNYIALSDSIQKQERSTRKKFTKIKYETQQFVAQNKKLHEQRNLLVGLSLGIALLGMSGFVIKTQRTKNKELLLKQEQQSANEKILRLLLDQQKLKEEGRQKERTRLSRELHDGILSKLFGLRLSLNSLNSRKDQVSVDQRECYLNDLKNLGIEIRQLSHELDSEKFTSATSYLSVLEEVLNRHNDNSFVYTLTVDNEIEWKNISGSVKLDLLRILQEAVKNILQHSHANKVLVNIDSKQEGLVIIIEDNGVGFDHREVNAGIGLKNMKSRTTGMGGTFEIKSIENKGTRIMMRVPSARTS